ncbi:pleckstrin homology domain-containing family B member 1 isoform X1 [Neoarius graeffei]|uniref:pleckstrin homology domain-containing family B member 1 isoform X1 n=1 Tax=Neoarius graeffei TaxID=443677 RepID=UPI00298C2E32|nr:pleckstrin homology domain-containing family B member 1 isoform X1 [Neoarius graeffei]XP_060764858.1 pleckstrin homology domain-containing family B member 1 isoform X1 [Neoarius graeffei]XP_060764859.1 pleckstrin homology domain-containing family B member 1 isoform X1 [Neoarius graeffei]XP_060764860.1 pleckstrin homology domain-containing family B member 1 isoform X1 [Neoarius graeffei]XP_060764861.1 pleckstrin homology domain-containing family B member 1 isoform X1 [Neoarius graeffei]
MFYKTDSRKDYETRVSLKSTCVNVKAGLECADETWSMPRVLPDFVPGVSPPESHPRENLLVLYLKDGSTMSLCADSEDEALAWKLTIMEAKQSPFYSYDPYNDTYQSVPVNGHNAVYIAPGNGSGGTHHVWVHRERCNDWIGEQIALGLLAGMAAGTVLRSFLWMPLWYC